MPFPLWERLSAATGGKIPVLTGCAESAMAVYTITGIVFGATHVSSSHA